MWIDKPLHKCLIKIFSHRFMKPLITSWIGILCHIPAAYVMFLTVTTMLSTFNGLDFDRQTDSYDSFDRINHTVEIMFWSLPLTLLGVICLITALFVQKYRAKWFFFFMLLYSIMWLFSLSFGVLFGIALMAYLYSVRREFFPPGPGPYFTHKNRA